MQNMPIKLKILFSIFIVESVFFFLSVCTVYATETHNNVFHCHPITSLHKYGKFAQNFHPYINDCEKLYYWFSCVAVLLFCFFFFFDYIKNGKLETKIRISVVNFVFFYLKMKLRLNGFCVLFWPS